MVQTNNLSRNYSTNLAYQNLSQIKTVKPVIHNISNLVTMSTVANVLLAIGASPIMAHATEELNDIINLAQALVVNIGTLDKHWVKSIEKAQSYALTKKIPIIFDPVGAGATIYRTQAAKKILQQGVDIMRGNASEILALTENKIISKGIDTIHNSQNAIDAATYLSKNYSCVVVISGSIDMVVKENYVVAIEHGTVLFTKVTGMGCAVTAVIGAFAAINANYLQAAVYAMALFSRAGEIAANHAYGCGSFYPALLDALSSLQENTIGELQIR